MKLHLLDRTSPEYRSFKVSHHCYPHFLKIWHHHPELELVFIVKSTGTHFIGDTIERFEAGEVVLIGKNLPHMWLNDEHYFDEASQNSAEAIAIHFKEDFMGKGFLEIPEAKKIQELLYRADRGIKFIGLQQEIKAELIELSSLDLFTRKIRFVEILQVLANHEETKMLSNPNFVNTFYKTENKRLDKIYEFVYNNFKENISSKNIADLIGMNPSAFSRYFKRIHRKTFVTYLNEIRVGYACKLLLERDLNITAVGYESGFNNLSNFNRQFKNITKMSPSKYRKFHAVTYSN